MSNQHRPHKSNPASGFSGGFFGCFGVGAAILAVFVLLFAIGECHSDSSPAPPPGAPSAGAPHLSGWVYQNLPDALQDKPTKLACTHSLDEIHQDLPYSDTGARLCIRQSPRSGSAAFVTLDGDGQVLCDIVDGCTLHVRFDRGPVVNFAAAGPADNSTNVVFFERPSALTRRLRNSSTAVVELRIYQNGDQPLTFDTSGLKWP
jgi:hypothetical protein